MEATIAEVKSLSHEGRGVASVDGKTVFIEGALPGEKVSFTYRKRKPRFDEAKVLEILQASPERTEPRCKHFSVCGGCSLQHLDPKAQIEFKQKVVLEQLLHFGGVEPELVLPPILGSAFGYRTRARLGVKFVAKKAGVLVGFREKDPRYIADLEHCDILHPSIGYSLLKLKALLSQLAAFKSIPQIEVAVGENQAALIFRNLLALQDSDQEALINFGRQEGIAIYLQPAGPGSIFPLFTLGQDEFLRYSLPDFNLEFKFKPSDFTQVNPGINRQMVNKVIELLAPQSSDRILDLFCGLGNFTLALGRFASKVVGVEGDPKMVERALQNAKENNVLGAEFYAQPLHLPFETASWAAQPFNKILLDPPRTGALECLPFLAKQKASRIVYVSCNPATLARDLGELVKKHKYQLKSLCVLDMFPHTTHVESIAVLER